MLEELVAKSINSRIREQVESREVLFTGTLSLFGRAQKRCETKTTRQGRISTRD